MKQTLENVCEHKIKAMRTARPNNQQSECRECEDYDKPCYLPTPKPKHRFDTNYFEIYGDV